MLSELGLALQLNGAVMRRRELVAQDFLSWFRVSLIQERHAKARELLWTHICVVRDLCNHTQEEHLYQVYKSRLDDLLEAYIGIQRGDPSTDDVLLVNSLICQ